MTTLEFNTERAEQFGGQMVNLLNHAFLSPLVSIGHQTGLFDTMAGMPPATSETLARTAGLNERYVREWLAAMTVARIVEYDTGARTYVLPPEHAASLTRAAGPNNLGFFAQYIALFAGIEQPLVECFRNGGGVPYSAYGDFQRLQREETAAVYDATLLDLVLPLVPGLVERLQGGIEVADFGCGSGHAINLMADRFPNSRFIGFDFSEEGVAAGRAEAAAHGLTNAIFEMRDVATITDSGAFDLITAFNSVHDQARPATVLANIARGLRPGGVFLMQDIAGSSELAENLDQPFAPLLYSASVLHCMTVSLAQGGEGLGTMWGEQKARELLAAAGFTTIEVRPVEEDPLNIYYICTRDRPQA